MARPSFWFTAKMSSQTYTSSALAPAKYASSVATRPAKLLPHAWDTKCVGVPTATPPAPSA